jgi:glycosyltransferase involved in cell wall biosynthesis
MKLAHLAKPWLPVPSRGYGAIEKFLSFLIDEQEGIGDILLFAPGDSKPPPHARLLSLYTEGQGDKNLDRNTELAQAVHCAVTCDRLGVDLIHAHSVDPFLGLTPFLNCASIFTYYSNPTPAGKILSQLAPESVIFTFLSNSHRKSFGWIERAEVVYPGVNIDKFPFNSKKGLYLAFVGSIADKKGILEAIEISKRSHIPLKIAAKVRKEDQEFYEAVVKNIIATSNHVEFLGEVEDIARNNLLKSAFGLLFPIKWDEPFGLTMIESMAVGTPVIAFDYGSVSEVICNGETGFVVKTVDDAVEAVKNLYKINPLNCRAWVAEKFSSKKMAAAFMSIYEQILNKS